MTGYLELMSAKLSNYNNRVLFVKIIIGISFGFIPCIIVFIKLRCLFVRYAYKELFWTFGKEL